MTWKLGLLCLWTAILLVLLFGPVEDVGHPVAAHIPHWDKVAHFGLFGITGLVAAYSAEFLKPMRMRILFGLAFALVLGVSSEVIQTLIPYRTGSFYDLLADVAGVSLSLLLYALLRLR